MLVGQTRGLNNSYMTVPMPSRWHHRHLRDILSIPCPPALHDMYFLCMPLRCKPPTQLNSRYCVVSHRQLFAPSMSPSPHHSLIVSLCQFMRLQFSHVLLPVPFSGLPIANVSSVPVTLFGLIPPRVCHLCVGAHSFGNRSRGRKHRFKFCLQKKYMAERWEQARRDRS